MSSDCFWKFSQCFGEKTEIGDVNDADIISAVEFDKTGQYLATGDRGGRVVIFEAEHCRNGLKYNDIRSTPEYRFLHEFQSHEPEFDYLKSLEIEEKINRIRWCRPSNNALFLLSTNDKTIKLWKVYEKELKTVTTFNNVQQQPQEDILMDIDEITSNDSSSRKNKLIPSLKLPKIVRNGIVRASYPRRVYANAHAYHINSVSVNSDGETFISADDLRINLWNLNRNDQSYTIVDIKPENMEELTEVITSADFHPMHCNMFMYSSSRGSIRLGDMRMRALCDSHYKTFEEPELANSKSFFSEIIASLSDIKFTLDGRYIVSRDYLTLKIWDINMEHKPVKTISIHDNLRPKLNELYENECIFDKFELTLSGDGNNIATGSYNNKFHIYDRYGNVEVSIEASKMPTKQLETVSGGPLNPRVDDGNFLDFNRKVMHMSWHPGYPLLAVAGLNNLYIYSH